LASRRSHLTLVALLLAALVGVFLLGWSGSPIHKNLRQGLDLQGGLEVVLQAQPPRGHVLTSDDMARSVDIIRNRIDKLGVSEPVVTKQGANQIVVELPAVHNINQAASIIGETAQLELYDMETSLVPPSIDASENPAATTSLYALLTSVQSGQKGLPSQYYLFNSRTKKPVAGPTQTLAQLKQDPAVKQLKPLKPVTPTSTKKGKAAPKPAALRTTKGFPTGFQLLTVPSNRVVITCDSKTSVVCPGVATAPAPGVTYYYLFKHILTSANPVPQMTGKDLKLAGTRQDFDPTSGQPIVTIQFTGHGNKLFHQITRDEAVRGSTLGTPQHFAIVLDNELRSFPQIDYQKYPDGIDPTNGGAEITGMAGLSEAKNLALVLQTGALPVKFVTVERSDVSATLGKDSLHQARDAAIGGLIVVALFLLLLYRFLGLIAVVGLAVYCALMYGAILLLGVTLTLPGFAGLILTIGVAADANVVIFERIKEEVRGGRSVRAAIAAGYQKGFRTIVDANVVTCITALILFAVATAQVKGFALMLLIGTVVSLITAVAATRAMLGLFAGFRWFSDPRFMGATATEIPRWQRINVVGHRRLWLGISIAAIVLSVIAIGVKGLNLGIDFKGGVQVTFTTPKPTSLSTVRQDITQKGAVVQGRGSVVGSDSYKSFQIRLKKLTPGAQAQLTNTLTDKVNAEKLGVKNVSASFSRQILRGAIVAIIVSFALIALYVTLRYRWRFAIPILRTLLNDIPIALGVYAISGREVSAGTVAAILTILGYSVYDTIIVFDRVRENIKLLPRASIATIANLSVWEVLRRSIVTSVITLLPIIALFVFGGATLRDFAFAIMVGITIGAVSTIFVATPLLTSLMERDPEFARRKDAPLDEEASRKLLRRAEREAAAEPAPEPVLERVEEAVEQAVGALTDGDDDAKRERRRQRRRSRPHGRAR
jgi:SecD/SecF fusion protein